MFAKPNTINFFIVFAFFFRNNNNKNKTHNDGIISNFRSIANHFDSFFHARVDNQVVPSHMRAFGLFFLAYTSTFGHFCTVVDFGNFEN